MNDPDVLRQLRSIAANTRRHRARLGLTQEQLGESAGISYRYLQEVEQGRKNITVQTLVQLARALHVGSSALLVHARLQAPRPGRPPTSGRGKRLRPSVRKTGR